MIVSRSFQNAAVFNSQMKFAGLRLRYNCYYRNAITKRHAYLFFLCYQIYRSANFNLWMFEDKGKTLKEKQYILFFCRAFALDTTIWNYVRYIGSAARPEQGSHAHRQTVLRTLRYRKADIRLRKEVGRRPTRPNAATINGFDIALCHDPCCDMRVNANNPRLMTEPRQKRIIKR